MKHRILAAVVLLSACGAPRPLFEPPKDPAVDSLYAPHRRGDVFFNPWAEMEHGLADLLQWKLFSSNEFAEQRKQAPEVPRVENDGALLASRRDGTSVTWIGHATALVEDQGDFWLTDPMFSDSLISTRHRLQPPGIPLDRIPAPKFAVVSHSHYDHLDLPTLVALPAETVVAVPLGLAELVRDAGHERVVELDWWQSVGVGDWTLTFLPVQHASRRGVVSNDALWGSWLVEGHGRRYYFGGDTGYFHGFREFGRRFGAIDVAILPIGAYAPRWFMQYVHMDPGEALQAFTDLRASYLVPVHWGTFDLSDEPPGEPPHALRAVAAERAIPPERIRVLAIGETFELPSGT